MSPAIVVRDLRKSYGLKAAVDGLDLEVPRGSFFGFLGPNGAGKSTTIRMLTGLIPSDGGTIEILGFKLPGDELEIKRRIGLVPDESLLFDRLTGVEFLEFVGRMYGLPRPTAMERAGELMDLFQLQADRKIIGEYSKGMRKRVAMAASLIHHPELFLMDEPFEGVDAVGARLMKDILTDQVQRGATIFLTTHVLEVVERLCDRVAIINEGRIVISAALERIARRRRIARGRFRPPGGRGPADRPPGVAMIAAILRAQLLSMRMGGRGRVISVITGLFWYGVWVIVACAVYLGVSGASAGRLQTILPLGALAVCLYWQAMPILSASMGSALDMRKLMVYPGAARQAVSGGGAAASHHGRRDADGAGGERCRHVPPLGRYGVAVASGGADLHRLQPAAGQRHAQPPGTPALQTQGSRTAGLRDFHAVDAAALSCT